MTTEEMEAKLFSYLNENAITETIKPPFTTIINSWKSDDQWPTSLLIR